jgi:hypothetical protein
MTILGQSFLGNAGVTGGAPHFGDVERPGQFPYQCMLASTGAND